MIEEWGIKEKRCKKIERRTITINESKMKIRKDRKRKWRMLANEV